MNFEEMTVDELKDMLKDNGVSFRSNATKESLIRIAKEFAKSAEPDAEEDAKETEKADDVAADDVVADDAEEQSETSNVAPAQTDKVEQVKSPEQVERPFNAFEVCRPSGYPFVFALKNDTPSARVFPELRPADDGSNVVYGFSEWREFLVENESQVTMLESNLEFFARMEKWDTNRRIQIAKSKKG